MFWKDFFLSTKLLWDPSLQRNHFSGYPNPLRLFNYISWRREDGSFSCNEDNSGVYHAEHKKQGNLPGSYVFEGSSSCGWLFRVRDSPGTAAFSAKFVWEIRPLNRKLKMQFKPKVMWASRADLASGFVK